MDLKPAQPLGAPVLDLVHPDPQHHCFEQGCLKQKSVLGLTAGLTEGVVHGKKLNMRQAFRSCPDAHCPRPAAKDLNIQSEENAQRIG